MVCVQQWNAHFFLLSATKLYYTDETSVFSQNDAVDEDEEADEKEEEDNVTNANMEVSLKSVTYYQSSFIHSFLACTTTSV